MCNEFDGLAEGWDNLKDDIPSDGHKAAEALWDYGDKLADAIQTLQSRLAESEADGWELGMRDAAVICGILAETTYDEADALEAATGCNAEIHTHLAMHKRARAVSYTSRRRSER